MCSMAMFAEAAGEADQHADKTSDYSSEHMLSAEVGMHTVHRAW